VNPLSSHLKTSRDYTAYASIFIIALSVRFLFLSCIDDPILFIKYPFFAEKLAGGESIGERLVDLSPFYLYFLAFLKKYIGINWSSVKYLQAFIGSLVCLILLALGYRVFRREAAVAAALIYAVYGNLIILESTLEPTLFVLLFNLLSVYFLFLAGENSKTPRARYVLPSVAGFFSGLSIITKPSFLLFLPLGMIWLFSRMADRLSFLQRLVRILTFSAAAFMVVLPITARNYVKLGDFVLVTADAGKVFYHGNGPGASVLEGTGLPDEGFAEEGADEPDYAHVLFRNTAKRLSGKDLAPSEASRFWFKKTLSHIISDPKSYVIRELKKCIFFFTDYEMHFIASAYKEYKDSLSFPFIRYSIIVSLGLAGILLSWKRFTEIFLIHGVIILYLLSGMLFLVQSRYRIPAAPYLCLFAGWTVFSLKKMIVERKFVSTALILLATAVFFFVSYFSFRSEIVKIDRWQVATKIHYQIGAVPQFTKGRYGEAIVELQKCLALAPNFSPAHNLLGKSYAVLGRYEEAMEHFKKVVFLSPNMAKGYKNIGFLYLVQGNSEQAKPYLKKAFSLSPHDEKVKKALEEIR